MKSALRNQRRRRGWEYEVAINAEFEISEVSERSWSKDDPLFVDDVLEMCWFDFPIPFTKGDVVKNCADHDDAFGSGCGPFVFVEYAPEREGCMQREHPERERRPFKDYMDTSEMCAEGYFQLSEKGELYRDFADGYMNLEYYRGDYLGVRRIMEAALA